MKVLSVQSYALIEPKVDFTRPNCDVMQATQRINKPACQAGCSRKFHLHTAAVWNPRDSILDGANHVQTYRSSY